MIELSKSKIDIPFEDSIPEAMASLEAILCTEELQRRPSRPPDYERENRALVALVSALADSPSTILQTLAETILDITQCDSAGLSLLTRDDGGKRFYWPAIAGMWNPHVGGGTPRNFGPCGDVLDQNRTLLFRHFERRYPYLLPVIPAAEECLLVPFYVAGKAVGTIWAIMHSDRRKFDAEDDRVMGSLGKFASSAYQALVHIDDLKLQVAEREKAEAEVRKLASGLEAKIRRLVEANVVGIVIWNLQGAITEANEAFLHMVQYAHEDIASGHVRWTDLTPAEWRGHDERAIADLEASGIFQPFEKEYFRKDGTRVPVLLGGALFERSANEAVAFVLDLTEQKRAQERLRASDNHLGEAREKAATEAAARLSAVEQLRHADRLTTVGKLASGLAHELGTPLNVVAAQAKMIAKGEVVREAAVESANAIYRQAERMIELIRQLLDFARRRAPQKSRVDLQELTSHTLALLEPLADKRRVNLRLTGIEKAATHADFGQIEQALTNLVINGIQAMPRGGDLIVDISPERAKPPADLGGPEAEYFRVSIRDSGGGIPNDVRPHIFEPFFTTKGVGEGAGLGLSVSHGLIREHAGWIAVESELGHGSSFSIYLPKESDAGSSADRRG